MDRQPERELIPMALTHGTAVIPWSPLVSGFLIGKYKRGQERPAGSRLEKEKVVVVLNIRVPYKGIEPAKTCDLVGKPY